MALLTPKLHQEAAALPRGSQNACATGQSVKVSEAGSLRACQATIHGANPSSSFKAPGKRQTERSL